MITGLKRALCCHQELPVPYVSWWYVFYPVLSLIRSMPVPHRCRSTEVRCRIAVSSVTLE